MPKLGPPASQTVPDPAATEWPARSYCPPDAAPRTPTTCCKLRCATETTHRPKQPVSLYWCRTCKFGVFLGAQDARTIRHRVMVKTLLYRERIDLELVMFHFLTASLEAPRRLPKDHLLSRRSRSAPGNWNAKRNFTSSKSSHCQQVC